MSIEQLKNLMKGKGQIKKNYNMSNQNIANP